MPKKIVFFNHYHRGDLLTHKEFVRQLQEELPDCTYEYMHFNHSKLTRDLDIPKIGEPTALDHKTPFYQDGDSLYVNTWIGCHWDIFCENGGINMDSLWAQWNTMLDTINPFFGTDIKLRTEKESYLPSIDFTKFNVSSIDDFVKFSDKHKRVLICNGAPKSGQSFNSDMKEFLDPLAEKYTDVHFICTQKFSTDHKNIFFTDDIILDTDIEDKRAPWEDRELNNCDLQEISYLSEMCDLIVGKNSGPFVFCETKNNYMNPNKKFLSFNVSWGIGKAPTETMSHNLNLKCEYTIVPVTGVGGSAHTLSDQDVLDVSSALDNVVRGL
jgi:hypothetical protein